MFSKYFYRSIILSVAGLLIALFLTYQYSQPVPMVCVGEAYNSCEVVRHSSYSYLLGVRVPLVGAIYFIWLLALQVFMLSEMMDWRVFMKLFGLSVVGGFLFETYMTYIQYFEIGSFCFWCSMVELVVVLSLLNFLMLWREYRVPTDISD